MATNCVPSWQALSTCEERGITRDYTPFLLILQGMALQLQGIALPSLLISKGRSLTCVSRPSAALADHVALELGSYSVESSKGRLSLGRPRGVAHGAVRGRGGASLWGGTPAVA